MTTYHQDFRAARQSLKDENYTGSFKLKKGMPMHTKMVELELRRVTGAAAPGIAGAAGPESQA